MQFFRLLLVSGPPEDVKAAAQGHAEQLDRLRNEGRLRLAGTFANGDGYCEILDVADR